MTGRRVGWYFLAFFGFVAAVNAVMVTLAIRTHSGIVTEHPYEQGLAYNEVVKAADDQESWGWKVKVVLINDELQVQMMDKNNVPLKAESVNVYFYRPSQTGMDFNMTMEGMSAKVKFPAGGIWEVRLWARVGIRQFQHTQRIVVP